MYGTAYISLCFFCVLTIALGRSGYFDVRDHNDQWIRIDCRKGDMIVLPEGIYHRFTLDEGNYIKVLHPRWSRRLNARDN